MRGSLAGAGIPQADGCTMRTDKLFYELFRKQPDLIFSLLPELPADGRGYRFQSPVLKAREHRLDGVLEPPADRSDLPVVILEVQMHSDPDFLLRLYAESARWLQQRLGSRGRGAGREDRPEGPDAGQDWQVVVICPSRRLRFGSEWPVEEFVQRRVRWLELEDCSDPLLQGQLCWQALQLLVQPPSETQARARSLWEQARREPEPQRRQLSELILLLIPFILNQASVEELREMLGLTIEEARESAAVREWMEEGRLEGLQTGRQEGRQEGETSVLLRQLERRCGTLPGAVEQAIRAMPQEQLLELADAVLEVRGLEDLQNWLRQRGG
jgi:predicted transposase YdaD